MKHSLLAALLLCVTGCSSTSTPAETADAGPTPAMIDSGAAEPAETGASTCTAETGAACGTCHKGDKSSTACGTVDNNCNDDATCNGAENAWFMCLCFAKGDAAASTKCDDTFKTNGGTNAATVVTCLRGACTGTCY